MKMTGRLAFLPALPLAYDLLPLVLAHLGAALPARLVAALQAVAQCTTSPAGRPCPMIQWKTELPQP
jgi:hypothetical protein